MDESKLTEYLEIVYFVKKECVEQIYLNNKLKNEIEFYNKYPFYEKFIRKFKCGELFELYEVDNEKYQQIVKFLCPSIDLTNINKKKKLKNFFEQLLIAMVFVYLFANEFYVIYRYNNLKHDKSLSEITSTQKKTIDELSAYADNLNNINNNIEESINNRTLSAKTSDLEKEEADQNNILISLNLFLNNTALEYNTKLQDIENIIDSGSRYIENVPTINQYPDYPSGCESISLLMLLKYAGVDVNAAQIVDKLRKTSRPYYVSTSRYGNDPETFFIGEPTDIYGFGVYEKPITAVAQNFKSGIKNMTGSSLDGVLKVVMQGHPVQVWVAMDGTSTYYEYTWIDELTGKTILYPAQFHSLVIIGFNKEEIITSDPSVGKVRYFERYNFEKSFEFFGRRAIYYE